MLVLLYCFIFLQKNKGKLSYFSHLTLSDSRYASVLHHCFLPFPKPLPPHSALDWGEQELHLFLMR